MTACIMVYQRPFDQFPITLPPSPQHSSSGTYLLVVLQLGGTSHTKRTFCPSSHPLRSRLRAPGWRTGVARRGTGILRGVDCSRRSYRV